MRGYAAAFGRGTAGVAGPCLHADGSGNCRHAPRQLRTASPRQWSCRRGARAPSSVSSATTPTAPEGWTQRDGVAIGTSGRPATARISSGIPLDLKMVLTSGGREGNVPGVAFGAHWGADEHWFEEA